MPDLPLEQTTYGLLIQLSSLNQAQAELRQILGSASQRSMGKKLICGVLLAVEDGRLADAIDLYRKAIVASTEIGAFTNERPIDNGDLRLLNGTIFNAVKQDPLSKYALQYSQLALNVPLSDASMALLRKQFALAAQSNRYAELMEVIQSLGAATQVKPEIRQSLRIEFVLRLWNANLLEPSMKAYVKSESSTRTYSAVPDRFVLEFMKRVPSLGDSEQELLYKCFLSGQYERFPWLHCYSLPVRQPVPERFREAATANGLIHQAVGDRQHWVSVMQWLAAYAERHGKQREVVDAATQSTVGNLPASWGAALLAARLDVPLTADAFKNRLNPVVNLATATDMHALMDCCRHNDQLRAVAVELIINCGFPDIALQAGRKSAPAEARWKHWLVFSESTPIQTNSTRSPWALSEDAQWTMRPSAGTSYLMLRYPIEGDISLGCNALQVSGSKFGIGYGGLAMLQSDSSSIVRCIGAGQRQGVAVNPTESLQTPELPLRLQKLGNAWDHANGFGELARRDRLSRAIRLLR